MKKVLCAVEKFPVIFTVLLVLYVLPIVPPKVHIYEYLEYHSVCPLVQIGIRPPPLPQASVSPRNQSGGDTSADEGVGGGDTIRTTGEKA
jgi:hypothetical protein